MTEVQSHVLNKLMVEEEEIQRVAAVARRGEQEAAAVRSGEQESVRSGEEEAAAVLRGEEKWS